MKNLRGLPISWQLAKREIRNGFLGFKVLIACLVLGVATIGRKIIICGRSLRGARVVRVRVEG